MSSSTNAYPKIFIQEIFDQYVRQNFQNESDYFTKEVQLVGFTAFELVYTAASANVQQAHGLGFAPLDILVMHLSGPGTVTFNYGKFDSTYLYLDVTDACRIRFLVGTTQKITSNVQTDATAAQKFSSGV